MSKTLTQSEFHTKSEAIYSHLMSNLTEYNIPTSEFDTLTGPRIIYLAIYALASIEHKATRNHQQVEQLDDATDTYKPITQHIEAAWIKNNPFIPNSVKIEMFCHIDDHIRHAHNGPVTIPVAGAPDLNIPRHVGFYYRDSATPDKTAKPDPDDVCEAWVCFPKDDTSPRIFNYRTDSSTDKISIPFTDDEAGKTVVIRLCWKNKKGRGEFGADITVIVPK